MSLYEDLRAYRSHICKAKNQPAFCIFSNKVLEAIVHANPQNVSSLLGVKGMGPSKVDQFGAGILECTAQAAAAFTIETSTSSSSSFSSSSSSKVADEMNAQAQRAAPDSPLKKAIGAPSTAMVVAPALNAEQLAAESLTLNGDNIFITGAAGTGKSHLLRHLITSLKLKYGDESAIAITAPTGIAATNVSGVTIHSWAGVGLAKGLPEEVVKKVMNSAQACERWRTCKVLVIDEVSMLDNQLFEKLDAVGRTVRKTPHFAFGGIQLILTGDFFQLPPVGIGSWGKKFAFQSNVWGSCNMQIVLLKTVVRQEGDQAFIRLLNEFRLGNASPSSLAALALCSVAKKPFHNDGVLPTRLYCTNAKVDDENRDRLEQLPGHSISFEAGDIFRANEGGTSAEGRKKLLALIGKKTPSSLKLKVGAQVVLTVNRPSLGLVNGSRGVVVGLAQKHKIYEGDKEAFGVAAGEYDLPLVQWDDGQVSPVKPSVFYQRLAQEGSVNRTQVPLKLAWALTVHKSQGMTLSQVTLLLADAFEFGQAYVALSRCTSLAGMWLSGPDITAKAIKAHPDVILFYARLEEEARKRKDEGIFGGGGAGKKLTLG
ncbi:hypothetical protein TrRE_jg7594 [Triparma retinervis]|uniref:ATP-dependent DNA helicase n=1 Tax=Triparma retinervis TaxID=2557542 RepID=A0A9W7A3Q6_9STRA|nr:hypothetical protein TrRE_jg7594 [Triparma retinervis]